MGCPICEHPGATVATVFSPPEAETGYRDWSVILNCPSCGTLYDEEIQQAINDIPVEVPALPEVA